MRAGKRIAAATVLAVVAALAPPFYAAAAASTLYVGGAGCSDSGPGTQAQPYTGAAFPSGHATQSAAFYAMLAVVLGAGLSSRRRAILWSAAALVVVIVGASRIYLGAHWLTDVLGGYALGVSWVAIVVAVLLITSRGTGRARAVRERGQAPTLGHHNRRKAA